MKLLFESADTPKPPENVRRSSDYKYPTGRTARAFCERSAIYIWASAVRATVGHAPRHAPPSLSLGSLGDSARYDS